jgi:dTDP-3,4-didehydro-2,6-dideoxy-alpha-D-glucose 3-reductase
MSIKANKKIRLGVLGCANIARRSVLPAVKQLTNRFELTAVASRSADKAREFSREFGCRAVVGYDQLITTDDVDALYIPLPTGLHDEWVNKALQAGKHVYAEKSIAACHADAAQMVSNARQRDVSLMEGYMFQYHSQHQVVFDLLCKGAIGEIRHFSSSFGFPPLAEDNFRYDAKLGGGVLFDAAGYPLRAAHFILGNSMQVRGATLYHDDRKGTAIYGSAFLSNANGLGASLAFGFDNFYQCRYEIWGAKGKITAERAFTPRANFSPAIVLENDSGTRVIHADPDDHFMRAFEEFYSIITDREGRQKHYSDILLQSKSLDLMRAAGHSPAGAGSSAR